MAALMLLALPAYAAAQATTPAKEKPAKTEQAAKTEKAPAAKAMTAAGTVTSVSADSLTIKAKTEEMTFSVDSKTKVTATGASHKTEAMKGENKPTVITDFVKVGDNVNVTYHDMGGTKHAASVRVRQSKPAAK
jgi:hypothetical protein